MSGFTKPKQLPVGVGIEDFHSGNEVVDRWVQQHSKTARKRGTAVIYATSYCDDRVAGLYTLSTHSVKRSSVMGGWFVRNAPEQVPTVLLGMLGVDKRYQGRGLGANLLKDAIINSLRIAELAGSRALVVDPTDEAAASFYQHFGFRPLNGHDRMAIPIKVPSN